MGYHYPEKSESRKVPTFRGAPYAYRRRFDADQFAKATTGVTVMRPVGNVAGRVFIDENENGIWDEGDRGVPSVVLALNGLRKTMTDESGRYEFAGVAVGPSEVSLEAESLNAIYTPVALRGPVSVVFRTRASN